LSDGLARVVLNGKVGYIDRTGNFAIEPAFENGGSFTAGLGRTSAERDGIFGVIDKTGAWVFQTNYQQVQLAVAFSANSRTVFGWHFKKADRWGLLDLDGHIVLDADFDQMIQHCASGWLQAYKNKESLNFKTDGSPLQPPDGRLVDAACYGSVPPFTLKVGDKFGLVDASSNPVTPVQFDAITFAGPSLKNVKTDGKWGRIGSDGRWLLEPKYDYLSGGIDIFVASIDGKRGFMRSDGTWLIEPKFDAAGFRGDGTAFVTVSGATGVLRLADQSWAVSPRPGVMCDVVSQTDRERVILSKAGESWIDIGSPRIGLNLDFGPLTFLKIINGASSIQPDRSSSNRNSTNRFISCRSCAALPGPSRTVTGARSTGAVIPYLASRAPLPIPRDRDHLAPALCARSNADFITRRGPDLPAGRAAFE